MMEVDPEPRSGSSPAVIEAMLSKYREIRCQQEGKSKLPPGIFWDRPHAEFFAERESYAQGTCQGTLMIQKALRDADLVAPSSSKAREELLLAAARRGYTYLVRELVEPSLQEEASSSSPSPSARPVSLHLKDGEGNSLIHMAVLSKKIKFVKWMIVYIKTRRTSNSSNKANLWNLGDAMNHNQETPLTLAMRIGNVPTIDLFFKLDDGFYIHFEDWNIIRRTQSGFVGEELTSRISDGLITTKELIRIAMSAWNSQSDEEKEDSQRLQYRFAPLSFLDARAEAHAAVRNAIDNFSRPKHLRKIYSSVSSSSINEGKSSKDFRALFMGTLFPWWDLRLSSFDIDEFSGNMPREVQNALFRILHCRVEAGHVDDALWLLDYFKAPPSLSCIQGQKIHNIDYYSKSACSLMQLTVYAWTAQKANELLVKCDEEKDDWSSIRFDSHKLEEVAQKIFGMEGNTDKYSMPFNMKEVQWRMDIGNDTTGRWNVRDAWKKLQEEVPSPGKERHFFSFDYFGIQPKLFVALKEACSLPSEDFEESSHAILLKYFLEKTYRDNPNFFAMDLPNLSVFVAIDHLSLIQFLSKQIDQKGRVLLDLDFPLFAPVETDSADSMGAEHTPDPDNDCPICYIKMERPYFLECGHGFHHRCLFEWSFRSLLAAQNGESEDAPPTTHSTLASRPHLSYYLGRECECPYCKQAVRPSLSEAIALNFADGLKRKRWERHNAPFSPHLDLKSDEFAGITLGEALLAFSACSGAVSILQWLVLDKGIDPRSIKAGGMNLMYFAMSHRQPLVIRWLLDHGYDDMLLGGMSVEEYNSFKPTELGNESPLEFYCGYLELESALDYLRQWGKILKPWLDNPGMGHQLSESERAHFASNPPNAIVVAILKSQLEVEQASAFHFLLMNGLVNYDGFRNVEKDVYAFMNIFQMLRSRNPSIVPKNWPNLILAFSFNQELRNHAKTFLAQKVIDLPEDMLMDDLEDCSFEGKLPISNDPSSFEHVIGTPNPQPISPLILCAEPEQYNLWNMLLRGEEWQSFYQVVNACQLWTPSAAAGLFDVDTQRVEKCMKLFVSAVILAGRVDILAAFSQMKTFCHPSHCSGSEPFDLFATAELQVTYSLDAVALRPLAEARGRMDTFRPFFDHIDKIKKLEKDLDSVFDETAKRIRDGVPLQLIKSWLQSLEKNLLSIPSVPIPLGVGPRDELLSCTNLSKYNWLTQDVVIGDNEPIEAFECVVRRNDPKIYHWIFGLTMKHTNYSSRDQESLDHFMYDVIIRISKCCSWDALEEFISFMTGPEGPQKYREDRPLLVTDLLNVDGRNVMKKKDSSTKNWVGGILGLLFEEALIIPGNCVFRGDNSKAPDPVEIANKIERIFHFVHALLADPIVTSVLSNTSSREKLIQNMMTGDPFSSSYLLTTSTSVAFRIVKLLQSKGFDLVNADLVSHFLRGFSGLFSLQTEENKEKQKDYLEQFYDGEVYRDDSSKLVFTAADLIRWMALNLRAPIQHISFQDFCDDTFFPAAQKDQMARFMTAEKFEALKKEQLELFNRS